MRNNVRLTGALPVRLWSSSRYRIGPTIGIFCMLLAGCKESKPLVRPMEPPAVLVTGVTQRDVPIYREWGAQLNGSVNAQIAPRVSGYIIKRNYKEGYFVSKGQILFEI